MNSITLLTDGVFPTVIGGMQKHSLNFVKALVRQGMEVKLLQCVPAGRETDNSLAQFTPEERGRIESRCIVFPKSGRFPGHYIQESYAYSRKVYKELLAMGSHDLIYAQGFTGWYTLRQKRRGADLPPVIVNFHGLEMYQPAPNYRTAMANIMLRFYASLNMRMADYVVSLGGKLTEIERRILGGKGNIIVQPNGIDGSWLDRKLQGSVNQETVNFVFIGRDEKRKGIQQLHEALESLSRTGFDFKFTHIGPLSEQFKIRDRRINYLGEIKTEERVREVLLDADVLICPSTSEGMPTVILEAMASHCAIMATDVGAVGQLVDERNGILLRSNKPTEIYSSMVRFLGMKRVAIKQRKVESAKRIKEFSWSKITHRFLDKFRSAEVGKLS